MTNPNPKVLHLRVVAGTGGGPEKTILNSPRFIREFGYDAEVAYLCPPKDPIIDELQRRAHQADCELTILPDRGPLDVSLIPRIVSICKRKQIDILQTHDYKSNFLGLIVRRLRRCHLATTLHGWTNMAGRMPLYKRIDQWSLAGYEALICVSSDLVEECRRLKIPSEKIHLIHNAIDSREYARTLTTAEAKTRLNARPSRFLIGGVGRLSPEKGFVELIDVVLKLQQAGIPIDLWIAGEGPERKVLESRIVDSRSQESIRLLRKIDDLRIFYQAIDLFVLNSLREGLPNVILEAMAMGTPVIATRVAGVPTLVKPGLTGRLIEPSDSEGLQKAILDATMNPKQNEDLVQNARQLILSEFDFSARMGKIARIYDNILRLR